MRLAIFHGNVRECSAVAENALREKRGTMSNDINTPGAKSTSVPSSKSTPSPSAPSHPPQAKLKSKKLDRTLAELETAFAAWDSITDEPKQAPVASPKKAAVGNDSKSQEQEFRAKTKKLLSQLRDQLADLSDD